MTIAQNVRLKSIRVGWLVHYRGGVLTLIWWPELIDSARAVTTLNLRLSKIDGMYANLVTAKDWSPNVTRPKPALACHPGILPTHTAHACVFTLAASRVKIIGVLWHMASMTHGKNHSAIRLWSAYRTKMHFSITTLLFWGSVYLVSTHFLLSIPQCQLCVIDTVS